LIVARFIQKKLKQGRKVDKVRVPEQSGPLRFCQKEKKDLILNAQKKEQKQYYFLLTGGSNDNSLYAFTQTLNNIIMFLKGHVCITNSGS
jgi:hypothetical protein